MGENVLIGMPRLLDSKGANVRASEKSRPMHDVLRAFAPVRRGSNIGHIRCTAVPTGRALITGVSGQDGSYLAESLVSRGFEVFGVVRPPADRDLPNLAGVRDTVALIEGDISEPAVVAQVFRDVRPDAVFHLAAPTFVPASWDDLEATVQAIAGATASVLGAALQITPDARVVVASSSEVFGDAAESPQSERSAMRPRNPYGAAKLAAHELVGKARANDGLHASSAITYNHESPRRPEHFLPRKVTRGAVAIARGEASELVLGNLDAVRDWSDARDIVRGMELMADAPEPGDYVLASGVGRTVSELVEVAFAAAGVEVEGRISVDPQFVRPVEAVPLIGDASLARERLGWRPAISFERMIEEMVAADQALAG